MAEFPAMPLWTDAYIGDTRHLSQAEHGAYLLLLITAWRSPDCSLPDEDRLLARYAACDMRTWRRQRDTILGFWTLKDGRWTQKRLSAERAYVAEISSKRAEAGSRGGRARATGKVLKTNDTTQANDEICSSKTQAPTPIPISTLDKESKGVPPPDLQKIVFDFGKSVLGNGSGGQVTRLKQHLGGDLERTYRTLQLAAGKSNPSEYVGAIVRGEGNARTDNVLAETDALYRRLGVQ